MKTYELVETPFGNTVVKCSDESWIPTDPANSDYAEYLRYEAWVAEGNEPKDFWTQEAGI